MKVKQLGDKIGQGLNIKETKLMTIGTAASIRTDNEDTEMMDSF